MDFTSWADWIRALLGAAVAYATLMSGWRLAARAAAFGDPHRHTGRRVAFVPRRAMRPRTEALRRRLRVVLALRRHQGLVSATPPDRLLRRLVEADRSARVLAAGRVVWCWAIPFTLAASGLLLAAWLVVWTYFYDGPLAEISSPYTVIQQYLGSNGWYLPGSESCASWSLLTGCEATPGPWWNGAQSGFLFGFAPAFLLAAWRIRRAARQSFDLWQRQEPPLLACLDALAACRDALRAVPPEATVLDLRTAELLAALRDFAQDGLPVDVERGAELRAHTARVAETLGEAAGQVLRDGTPALPGLIALLATVQDRLDASRWFVLLDPAQLVAAPGPGPGPGPTPPQPAAAGPPADATRWQRYMWVATAMPTVPALLALAFTAVTISQANETLGLSRRDQVASTYSDTVGGLGDDSVDVRISSLYALKRIMRETPSEQPAIVKILSAYVREHAKTPKAATAERLRKNPKTRPAEDVQAALDVLGSRTQTVDGEPYINLRDTFLVGADLATLDFTDADLRGSDLSRADLREGRFDYVWFSDGRMDGALLSSGSFTDAEFIGTDLTGAWLDGAQFYSADLTGAVLAGAQAPPGDDGSVTNLVEADLTGAILTGADLTRASLQGADLGKDDTHPAANVTDADFTDADLTGARLDGVDRATAAGW
ncbi:pentapeptide repeat-containing protein [Streptomyces sp. NBC_01275]|uniref:pentapeptide repeat-containing protein n=1 Tax=Streptomyces sp. NBC_01275 TaxID=2903807 RepID=UPI00224CB43D|nr:pentapeptide repeat-containing protein [Streptomyces sp. NBC_01275]MCX4763537.1 pentapeptide repeat-containing protein [Streptomyces sp. NBC_01275]